MIQPLKRVAFADDESGIRQVLELSCRGKYEVVGQAKNGLEAISLVKALRPQVLTLDIYMPIMNGLDALKEIVALGTTAVVILTADQDPETAVQAMNGGACGYITKPFEFSQVVPMLETVWHRFQTSQAFQNEIATLSESLETRKLLEKAKGILMEQQGMTEESAHKTLQKMSQDQAISLKEVCRSLIQVRTLLSRTVQRKAV
jgi:AmiR/NasT family two-component response regulator